MPRYVVLWHETPPASSRPSHYDLMLEQSESLRTWAVATTIEHGETVPAQQLSPHRLAYLDYEGPVSNQRGSVVQWDLGQYRLLAETKDALTLDVQGLRLFGTIVLERAEGESAWLLTYVHSDTSSSS